MDHYAFQAQLTRISPVGLVAEGVRIDIGYAGTMTSGPWAAHAVEGINYLLIRSDGAAVIDALELVCGDTGAVASIHAEGYAVPPFRMRPLAVILGPGLRWPDTDVPLHGSARVQAGSPGAAAANRTVFAFTGVVNMRQGSLTVTADAILAPPPATLAGHR